MSKATDVKKVKEARLRLEEHLKKVLIKKAEADDPDYKYKIELINENFETVVDDKKAYKFAVDEPIQAQINLDLEEGRATEYDPKIHKDIDLDEYKPKISDQEKWSNLILKLKIIEGGSFKPRGTAKEFEAVIEKLFDLKADIIRLNLDNELDDLLSEVVWAGVKVDNIKKERQKKMKPSKYPDELVTITSHLVEFWWNELEEEINAYSKGNTYDRSGVKDAVAKENLKAIDVKYNPGGAFLQRVLKIYFKQDLDNTQLKTLLSKVKKKVR